MRFNLKYFSILLLILILSGSCITSIKKIHKKPEKCQGKNVCIRGTVVSSIELYDLYCFTIKNRQGYIMVVTENLLPLKNDKLWVRGKLEKDFIYKEQNIIVIKEKKMKSREIPDSKRKMNKI